MSTADVAQRLQRAGTLAWSWLNEFVPFVSAS